MRRKLLSLTASLFAAPAFAQAPQQMPATKPTFLPSGTPTATAPAVPPGPIMVSHVDGSAFPLSVSPSANAALSQASGTVTTPTYDSPSYGPPTNLLLDNAGPARTPRAWVNLEYLVWFNSDMNSPTLIAGVPGVVAAGPGGAFAPAAQLFPRNRDIKFDAFNGIRGTAGMDFEHFGVDASVFALETNSEGATFTSTGAPVSVARQYINVATGVPTNLYSSLLGQYTGGTEAVVDSYTWGADINARFPGFTFWADRVDYLAGFRYLNLSESITMTDVSNFPTGQTLTVQDIIRTSNEFYGGQVGLHARAGACDRGLGTDFLYKFAFGSMKQTANLSGTNTYFVPGVAPDPVAGGLYARGPAAGTFTRNKAAVVTEATFNVTYNFCKEAQVFFGYTIVYATSVIRPGEAINPVINDSTARFIANQTPNTIPAPTFRFVANDYWVQGLNFGARFQY
jgi:hypothetical protein